MISDLLPLLAFATIVVLARNVFEAYVLENARRRMESQEMATARARRRTADPGLRQASSRGRTG